MGWLMKKWIILALLCIIGNSISAAVTMEKVDDVPWLIDSNVTYNELGTLKTGRITDGESTSVVLTFTDIDSIELFVKTSTEAGCDKLVVECNGEIYEYSGESDWEFVSLNLEDGHVVTVTYWKDGSISTGEDCCWVWFDGVESLIFDNTDDSDKEHKKKWAMSIEHPWSYCGNYTDLPPGFESRPYIEAPCIEDGEETWITYEVEGTQVFPFKYLIVTEENVYPLTVSVDGVDVASFGGRRIFESYFIELPNDGCHTIKWTYRKPIGTSCTLRIWFDGVEDIVLDGYAMSSQDGWVRDSENNYDGRETLRSGIVFEGGMASFSVTVPQGDETFEYALKVSSEEECDFLKVYKNDELINSISGDVDWESFLLEVVPGDVFTFEYTKDNNGLTSGEDCGWVYFSGIEDLLGIIHLFPEDANSVEVTQTIALNLNTGREVVREILNGDDGVSFATQDYPAWVNDGESECMRSPELKAGASSWMAATVVGKGMFSFGWRASGGEFICYVDGEVKETLNGGSDWARVDLALEEDARHEIKWVYSRDEDAAEMTYGWVDGIVWDAPEGWDDPDEPIVPCTVSTFIPLDLRSSPRLIQSLEVVERIVYNPAWVKAASAELTIGKAEPIVVTTAGSQVWTPTEEGVVALTLTFKDVSGNQVGEALRASFKVATGALPDLGDTATVEEVATILKQLADPKLVQQLTTVDAYEDFRKWIEAQDVADEDVRTSLLTWLSYALDANGLIAEAPKAGDLKVEGLTQADSNGALGLTFTLEGVEIGEDAIKRLAQVFEVVGGAQLTNEALTADQVQVTYQTPEKGKVTVKVVPYVEDCQGAPKNFFFRLKMKEW